MNLTLPLPPRESKAFDVVGFGEASLDLVALAPRWPTPDSKAKLGQFDLLPGGQTATAVVACARLGWRARFAGALGDDEFGTRVMAALASEGVDAQIVERPGLPSRTAVVIIDGETGKRAILEQRDPRLAIAEGELSAAVFSSGRILLVDATDLPAAIHAARVARAAGIPTIVDVERSGAELDDLLASIDVVIAPEGFFLGLTPGGSVESGLDWIETRFRPALTVATLGERGSLASCRGHLIRTPSTQVAVVDTTGAGDAFRGGFASGWLQGGNHASIERLLAYANLVARLNCRAVGAQTALPTPDEAPWSV
jgi:sulfofructose kinase